MLYYETEQDTLLQKDMCMPGSIRPKKINISDEKQNGEAITRI